MKKTIAQTKGYKLQQDFKTGQLHYYYDTCHGEMSFHFSLLCEVGQPYQNWFLRQLYKNQIVRVAVETATDYFEINDRFLDLYEEN